jgi:hypothetical protein
MDVVLYGGLVVRGMTKWCELFCEPAVILSWKTIKG